MKSAVITVCAALIIMCLAVWGDIEIRRLSNTLLQMCADIVSDIEQGDMASARVRCADMRETWDKTEATLSFFVCHSNLLDIQAAFVRVEYALDIDDILHLKLAAALLENEISDIPHLETVRLDTVL